MEIWKPIVKELGVYYGDINHPVVYNPVEIYEVSNMGRIRNKNTKHIKSINGNGRKVTLYSNVGNWGMKECLGYSIARVVYATFNGDPGAKQVKHRDGNMNNNSIDNLYI